MPSTKQRRLIVDLMTHEQATKLHTKQLLLAYNQARAVYSSAAAWMGEDVIGASEYCKMLKSILSTREHVPNKMERNAIRRANQLRKQVR